MNIQVNKTKENKKFKVFINLKICETMVTTKSQACRKKKDFFVY